MHAPAPPSEARPLIHGLTPADMDAVCREAGLPVYRANQILEWLYRRRVMDWNAMTNLPAALRADLAARFESVPGAIARVDAADERGDATRKMLVALRDGQAVEAVLIPAEARRTVCVSTQVGCARACAFCASGQTGLERNLDAGEIVGQVLLAGALYGARITHVVFMGCGEPFDNTAAVLKAVRILNAPRGLGIGARHLTISTCGVVPGIERLAGEGLQVELSVSLHAPDDALRDRLMPVNRRYPLAVLLEACAAYTARTGRIITFEYTLIRGVNDSPRQARMLAERLVRFPCRVNAIPLSPVREFDGAPTQAADADAFIAILRRAGINTTLRASRGARLQAACGQLRAGAAARMGTDPT
jgi:23S rRNA (adenine2503-C2)-methyltransferase